MMIANRGRTFLQVVVRCTIRLICIGALAWTGLMVADSVRSSTVLLGSNGVAAKDGLPATEVPDLSMLIPVGGFWSFADVDLSIRQICCSEDELNRQMESLLAIDGSLVSSNHNASQLIAIAEANGATRHGCPAGSVWKFDNAAFQLRLITSNSGSPGLIAAAFAIRYGKQWRLSILKPKRQSQDNLLPLPSDAKPICSLRGDTGQLQMELFSTSQSDRQLLEMWQLDGRDIRHTPWGSADCFSYLCVCGEEVVYVWSDSTAAPRTIMLASTTRSERIQCMSIQKENRQ